jgi:hypothetical protein
MIGKCPKVLQCEVLNNDLLKRQATIDKYKKLFCEAGKIKYHLCKRYQLFEKAGKCANFIMPDTKYPVDDIIECTNMVYPDTIYNVDEIIEHIKKERLSKGLKGFINLI